MDKSPNLKRAAQGPPRPADFLLGAVRSATAMMRKSVIIGRGDPEWTPPTLRIVEPERHRYAGGLHTHEFPEICIVVEGSAAMEVEGNIYRFEPPCIAVLTPGTEHSELFARSNSVYRLLWLGMTSDSLLAQLSCFRGHGRWELERVSPLQGPLVTRLRVACSSLSQDSTRAVEQVRGELLPVLAELYRYETLGRLRTQDAATPGRSAQIVERARSFIDGHFNQPIDVAVVAELTAMSPNYLNTLFSQQVGMGIKAYLIKQRMDHAMRLCGSPGIMMKQIAIAVGYQDPLYFSRVFRGYHGITPSEARSRTTVSGAL